VAVDRGEGVVEARGGVMMMRQTQICFRQRSAAELPSVSLQLLVRVAWSENKNVKHPAVVRVRYTGVYMNGQAPYEIYEVRVHKSCDRIEVNVIQRYPDRHYMRFIYSRSISGK
jgi:hypothetical protein